MSIPVLATAFTAAAFIAACGGGGVDGGDSPPPPPLRPVGLELSGLFFEPGPSGGVLPAFDGVTYDVAPTISGVAPSGIIDVQTPVHRPIVGVAREIYSAARSQLHSSPGRMPGTRMVRRNPFGDWDESHRFYCYGAGALSSEPVCNSQPTLRQC
jgi:hypothetical protein